MNTRISLAPMEGITTYIFRRCLHEYYGGVDTFYTPFLNEPHFGGRTKKEILPAHNEGLHVIPQAMANSSKTTLLIAEQLADYGYEEVNINLGCPSKTVVSKKHGSGMLQDLTLLDRYLDEVFSSCPLKVSVKTRIGYESLSEWEDILSIYKKFPITKLIIHPRLTCEFYQPVIHPEYVLLASEILPYEIVYNGDITSVDSFEARKAMFPQIEEFMIGRGLIFQPDLAAGIKGDALPGEHASMRRFRHFHDALLEAYMEDMMGQDSPVLQKMKELWAYFYRYLNLTDKELKEIRKTNRLSDYKMCMNMIFSRRS